jgi:hypothetical protein
MQDGSTITLIEAHVPHPDRESEGFWMVSLDGQSFYELSGAVACLERDDVEPYSVSRQELTEKGATFSERIVRNWTETDALAAA